MTNYEKLRSGCALVCHKDHRCDEGVGTVWSVLLADGFLIDCGHGSSAEARANILAGMINAGGESQWKKLDRDALSQWRPA